MSTNISDIICPENLRSNIQIKPIKPKPDIFLTDNLILQWTHDNQEKTLRIMRDPDPENPRDFENMCKMACFHRRYDLGDKIDTTDAYEYIADKIEQNFTHKEILDIINEFDDKIEEDIKTPQDLLSFVKYGGLKLGLKILSKKFEIMPLWLYDHSGITMSCGECTYPYNDQFDSSAIGWAFVSEKEAKSMGFGENWREKAASIIQSEVKTYDDYLQGDVWIAEFYEIISGNIEPTDEIISGFYGSYLIESGMADAMGYGLEDAVINKTVKTGEAKYKIQRTLEFEIA